MNRKPFGVWMLLQDGQPWMFCQERTLAEALLTARTLRGTGPIERPLLPQKPVWIAAPARIALKPDRERFRRPKP